MCDASVTLSALLGPVVHPLAHCNSVLSFPTNALVAGAAPGLQRPTSTSDSFFRLTARNQPSVDPTFPVLRGSPDPTGVRACDLFHRFLGHTSFLHKGINPVFPTDRVGRSTPRT